MKYILYLVFVSGVIVQNLEKKSFRIIAPQIICSKTEDGVTSKPDTTSVMVQSRGGHLDLTWTVRWAPLPNPSQRFTLLLWRSVRNLEGTLNREQPEPFLYVIDNNELLPDVDYIFNVTGIIGTENLGHKVFRINNDSGKRKLELSDGETDKFSLVLLGGDQIYADMEYTLEAQVTMCRPTQDYHFVWTLNDMETDAEWKSDDIGFQLSIPPGKLTVNHIYDVTCDILRSSDNAFINQMHYIVEVLQRGLEVALSSDVLVVSVSTYFSVEAKVFNHDHLPDTFEFEWRCIFNEDQCEAFENDNTYILELLDGFPNIGRHEIEVSVRNAEDSTKATISIETVEARLPVLEVMPVRRIVNEGSTISLVGNASNIAPSCSLTWYFAASDYKPANDSCEECMHGVAITETVTILSIEENFLTELADFSNATEWRQISAEIAARPGRARLVAECGCSLIFSCDTAGTVYADVNFKINHKPVIGEVTVTPVSGTALETEFTIRTQPAVDHDTPLRYNFYTRVGEDVTLLLNSYLEHFAAETYLPYIAGGTAVWVEVCDSLGACSQSEASKIHVAMPKGIIVEYVNEEVQAHLRRCEFLELEKIAVSAFVTFENSGKSDDLLSLSAALVESLTAGPSESCLENHSEEYSVLLQKLAIVGFDTSDLK